VTANGVRVIKSDWAASNGVIHFINELIHPIARENLKQVLESDGRFHKLLAAFDAAEMTSMLETSTSEILG
jgi:uncharacterized surface protein with fasciclin (FAS1) repeats